MRTILPQTKLLINSKELNIWSYYLAPTSVGRNIPDGGGRGTPGYRRKWQGPSGQEGWKCRWIAKVFGDVISYGSGQID